MFPKRSFENEKTKKPWLCFFYQKSYHPLFASLDGSSSFPKTYFSPLPSKNHDCTHVLLESKEKLFRRRWLRGDGSLPRLFSLVCFQAVWLSAPLCFLTKKEVVTVFFPARTQKKTTTLSLFLFQFQTLIVHHHRSMLTVEPFLPQKKLSLNEKKKNYFSVFW